MKGKTAMNRSMQQVRRGRLLLSVVAVSSIFTLEAVTLGPGQTLDWDADTPASGDVIEATGGTIVFNSDTTVPNNIYLGGEVAVTVNNGASVRFAKTLFQTDTSGRLVLPCTAYFGSDDASKFAFLPENAITFASGADDARLRLAGYVSLLVLPEKWSSPIPYTYEDGVLVAFYGGNMVTDAAYTVPTNCTVRMTSPTNFAAKTVITVPANSTLQDRPATFNPATCAGSGIDIGTTTVCSNDVILAGGIFRVMTGSTHHYWGDISGTGTINVNDIRPNYGRNVYYYFYGSLDGMDAQSRLTIDQIYEYDINMNQGARLNSDFPGTVKLNFYASSFLSAGEIMPARDTVSFGFSVPGGNGMTNENWRLGALEGGDIIGDMKGEGGARLQYSARQHIHVGTLSGKLAIFGTSNVGDAFADDLTVDTVADDTILYVKNGLRLHFGTVGKGVKIRYMGTQVNSNALEIASGAIEEISFLADLRSKPIYINGGAVENIAGQGTVVVAGGNVRIGAAAADVAVQARGGTLTFGPGADLDSVLGSRPALWLDASDTTKMTGAYNSGWAATDEGRLVLGANPAITFNGSTTATYTNGFPLIEKWFDKRPGQTWTYGWQDRCVNYQSTLYTLVYPYLVPNGLNGRAYMSFGEHGTADKSAEYGRSRTDGVTANHQERRRMPLMHDMAGEDPRGNAINACATILVFGSQHGGGRAILGGYEGNDRWSSVTGSVNPPCGGNYMRGGTGYEATNMLFVSGSGKSAWIDGESVNPATTPLSGGWQIISVTNAASYWRSLGEGDKHAAAAESGGQNYAEVISFTNAITAAERMAVENYLAMKWGLTNALAAKCSVTVSAGATVKGAVANVTGAGTWELDLPESRVAMDSTFAGTVSGVGGIAVADAADLPSLAPSFGGSAEASGGNLSFTYANGTFTPALVAPNADLSFPSAMTVTIATGGAKLPRGDYTLVQGGTLSGLTNLTLSHDIVGRAAKLVRTGNALVLRVTPLRIVISFR